MTRRGHWRVARAALYLPVIAKLDHTLGIEPDLLARINAAAAAYDFDGAASHISDDLLRRLAFAGTPDEVAAQSEELIAAGATRIEFGTPHGLSEESGIRLLGERVLPALRGESMSQHSDEFELYDLTVVVEAIEGNCTCAMRVGDCFYLRGGNYLCRMAQTFACTRCKQPCLCCRRNSVATIPPTGWRPMRA